MISQMPLLRQIFQVGSQYSLNFPGISRVMEDKMMFSNGPEGHNEVDVDFAVYSRLAKSKYRLHKCLCSGRYSKGGASIH